MAKTVKTEITYNDFSGGDWGVKDGFNVVAENLPMFRGENVQVYRSGALGPRPGHRQLTHSGVAPPDETDRQIHFGFDLPSGIGGIVRGRFSDIVVSLPGGITTFYQAIVNPLGVEVMGTLNGSLPVGYGFPSFPPANVTRRESGLSQCGVITINSAGTACTGAVVLAATPSARPSRTIVYRDRMYYYSPFGTVYYSEPGAYGTVPAANVFSLPNKGIYDAFVLKNTLFFVVTPDTIMPYGLYALTGASPKVGSISEVTDITPFMRGESFVVTKDAVIGLTRGTNAIWIFNGTTFEILDHLRKDPAVHPSLTGQWPYDDSVTKAAYASAVDAVGVPWLGWGNTGGNTRTSGVTERINGVWCYTTFPGNANPLATLGNLRGFASDPYRWIIKWCNVTGGPSLAQYFVRAVCLDRPGSVLDEDAQPVDTFPGSPFDGTRKPWFYLPPVIAPQGSGAVRVLKVVADIDYWKGGGAGEYPAAPTIECVLEPKAYYQDLIGSLGSTTVAGSMNETPAAWPDSANFQPAHRKIVFTFPVAAPSSEVYVRFQHLEGVAIHRVVVTAEIDQGSFPGGW